MNKKNEKKKPSLFSIIIIVAILFSAVSGELDTAQLYVLVVLLIIIAVIAVIVLAVRNMKKNYKMDFSHSHDRLTPNTLKIEAYDSFEHYKRQIDGFLAAGIIDRAEYKVLYEKYKKTLK